MSIFEYDEEKEIEKIRKAEHEVGFEQGIAYGYAEKEISVIRRNIAKRIELLTIAELLDLEEAYVKQVVDLIAENPEATDAQIVAKFQND